MRNELIYSGNSISIFVPLYDLERKNQFIRNDHILRSIYAVNGILQTNTAVDKTRWSYTMPDKSCVEIVFKDNG